jgi:hypothetical protein
MSLIDKRAIDAGEYECEKDNEREYVLHDGYPVESELADLGRPAV